MISFVGGKSRGVGRGSGPVKYAFRGFIPTYTDSHRLKHKNWELINLVIETALFTVIEQRPLTYSMKCEDRKFLTIFVSFLTTFCQSFETCTCYFPLELEFRHALKPGTPLRPGPLMNTKNNKAQRKKSELLRCSWSSHYQKSY